MTKEECLEALDELSFPLYDSSCGGCKCGTSDCQDCKKAQAVFTLEQLINEHFELKEKHITLECDYSDLNEVFKLRSELSKNKINQLEKALDMACKELHDNQMSEAGIDEDLHGIHPNFINAEEWKEWCMKGD